MNSLLNVSAVSRILPTQDAESSQLLFEILQRPQDTYNHVRRFASAVILASVYGQRGASFDAPNVQTIFHVQDQVVELLAPGGHPPVDAFTFLKYLPDWLAKWRSQARRIHKAHHDFYLDLFNTAKRRRQQGAPECMMSKLISEQDKNGMTDANIVHTGTPMVSSTCR